MILPDHIFAIITALHAANLALAKGDDEARRVLQQKIAETAAARHPGEGWGWKKAGEGRPPSKDAIANNKLMPGHLLAWDCFNGATRSPVQGDSEIVDDQVFIAVQPVDHLAGLPASPVVLKAPHPGPPPSSQPPQPTSRPAPASRAALPGREEFLAALHWLDTLYRTQLGRPGADFEGIAAHIFDTYLNERLRGATVLDARTRVVQQISEILGRRDLHP